MSIDTEAYLGYGWMVDCEELTPEFYLNEENDFACADGMLGTDYGYDLVSLTNLYQEGSPVFVGIPISTMKRVADEQSWHFENVTPDELASTASGLSAKAEELHELYCTVMGKPPKEEATVHLFARIW